MRRLGFPDHCRRGRGRLDPALWRAAGRRRPVLAGRPRQRRRPHDPAAPARWSRRRTHAGALQCPHPRARIRRRRGAGGGQAGVVLEFRGQPYLPRRRGRRSGDAPNRCRSAKAARCAGPTSCWTAPTCAWSACAKTTRPAKPIRSTPVRPRRRRHPGRARRRLRFLFVAAHLAGRQADSPGCAGTTRACPGKGPNCGWPTCRGRQPGQWPPDRRRLDEAIVQPEWSPGGTLYFVSDRSGWWNLHRFDQAAWCTRSARAKRSSGCRTGFSAPPCTASVRTTRSSAPISRAASAISRAWTRQRRA
jgi:hypothetical protein